MAREIRLSDGRTALFDDDASEAEINKQLKEKGLERATGPIAPGAAAARNETIANLPATGVMAASTLNSLAFGLPELIARGLGTGPTIDQIRQEFPVASTAGDIAGLINPAALGARLAGKGMSQLGSFLTRPGTEAGQQSVMAALRGQPVPQMIGSTARRVGETAGGVIGAQTGAAALGGAREPSDEGFTRGFYGGPGAQQGANVFRQTAVNMPGTQLVPGLQTTLNAVTAPVPAALGYGNLGYQYIEQQMREEAARRAMQGR